MVAVSQVPGSRYTNNETNSKATHLLKLATCAWLMVTYQVKSGFGSAIP